MNDFDFGPRAYRVYAQAAAAYRDQPRDIGELYVRSQAGALVSLDNLVRVKTGSGPPVISHYNLFRSIELAGTPAPGDVQRRGDRRHGGGRAQRAARRTSASSGRASPGRRCARAARRW